MLDPAQGNGGKALLWLNRASTLITAIMRGIYEGKDPKVAAGEAYETVLKPYHGFMTKKVVGTALGICPAKEAILQKLQLPTEEAAKEQIAAFLKLMEPLLAAIMAVILKYDIHFEDKV